MKESEFQAQLIKTIRRRLPGCIILKNDPYYLQGTPDLTILFNDRWAMLEIKASRSSSVRPNQKEYVKILNDMSFAAFIFPENETEILDELQLALGGSR